MVTICHSQRNEGKKKKRQIPIVKSDCSLHLQDVLSGMPRGSGFKISAPVLFAS